MTDFALCLTCPEITTGRMDASKGFLADASSNHFGCDVVPFTNISTLPPPVRNVVARLGANVPINNNDIVLLRLGLNLEDSWELPSTAPAAGSTSRTPAAAARRSDASTRSPRASTPISGTPVAAEDQLALFSADDDACPLWVRDGQAVEAGRSNP